MRRASHERAKRAVVLVFGESLNDAASIAKLLVVANPRLAGRVSARPRPTSLTREAGPQAIGSWVQQIEKAVRATRAAGVRVAAVVVHRDADGRDPQGLREAALARQLSALGGLPVVPVQELEAWWFLFPGAVEAVRPRAWSHKLPRKNRDVETIVSPKEELARLTGRGRTVRYAEADSVLIAENIARLEPEQYGTSASYVRMQTMAGSLS